MKTMIPIHDMIGPLLQNANLQAKRFGPKYHHPLWVAPHPTLALVPLQESQSKTRPSKNHEAEHCSYVHADHICLMTEA